MKVSNRTLHELAETGDKEARETLYEGSRMGDFQAFFEPKRSDAFLVKGVYLYFPWTKDSYHNWQLETFGNIV